MHHSRAAFSNDHL